MRRLLSAVAMLILLTSACGEDTLAAGTYDGPLAAEGRQGAAHRVVECDDAPTGGNNYPGEYDNGALSDEPEAALRTAFDEAQITGVHDGYVLVREDDDRALFTFTDAGRVRQALIVHDGEAFGKEGWYVESWARCDYAELPAAVAERAGVEIWFDADGPVSTRRVHSADGPEHCGWQHLTFLSLGETTYVRDADTEYAEWTDAPYDSEADLPPHAVDTGFHRDGDHLWRSPDGTRAYVGNREKVAVWPRTKDGFTCA
ncbi:hypothetical protein [Mumia sp. Pv 4-285]|uniref:hypothetical protein n=1 Tax=Mumia qirimensis TaxID=3234852 RepID=UPI00351D5306